MTISEKRRLGNIGENAACEFLRRRGYEVIEQNYLRKWGELDIVARKGKLWHFVEVKSASGHVPHEPSVSVRNHGSRETLQQAQGEYASKRAGEYRPEENVHPQKLKRLGRAIQTYILERRLDQADWQLDIITVKVDEQNRRARCEMLENIII